ncbi:TAXI family TRAP transporter solute-binding subunit [Methylocapsa sp. D3K7]|uniref:TAXI family TRAP transporter solute-binding subunit n=1 Tax=Methylocapsa sp. D3K7 TaxID=3041435 RepID=UPI00244E88A3|nr:TAXI family TRAP transporter solute-binding subunit [Methylocapsa sp. D3K7]WGJ15992.1 TAXI family TRAP transporter solute-binding subunit [Methylocapsa sp. D3K7]
MRPALLLTAGLLILATSLIAAVYLWSPHANLRVTIGPPGSPAYRFVTAFAAVTEANHPRVRIKLVPVADLAASAETIEDHTADLAIVRSDAVVPSNGTTIAILRRDVIAFVVPAKSAIDKISGLAGKTIGIPQGPLQTYNEQTLDSILSYYDIPPKSVKRVFLSLAEIGVAVAEKRVAAVFTVGPMAPGEAVDVVNAIKVATRGPPSILAIDEAEAINKRFPGLESIDVPAGAFRGRPPVPSDSVTTLAITYRFAAPNSMLDAVAGAIARSIFKTKTQMMAKTPLANQIEAPDPDDKNPVLPVHTGVANYLNSGEQSFFDEFQQYIYLGGMALSLGGSAIALLIGRLRSKKSEADLRQIDRLIELADKALMAQNASELKVLEEELNGIISWFVKGQASGTTDSAAFTIAISHAQHAIEKQRAVLHQEKAAPTRTASSEE